MNIYDIAARCGVSIATVSRVLNNSPRVRPQTRERVLAVMQEENYTPSALARGLGGGSMHMAGILCRDIRDSFQAAAVACLEEHLRQRGVPVLLRCVEPEPQAEKQAAEVLIQQGAEVLVLVGAACHEEEAACIEAAAARVPIVLLNGALSLPGVHSIVADERGAVRELTELLFRRQRRQILFLYEGDTYSCREKLAGYREGHEQCECSIDAQRMVAVSREPEAVNACVKQLLVQRVSFDAVMASEDTIALGAQKALQRIGLTMPIIGFHNSLFARCATPELTSVDTQVEKLCAAAVDVIEAVLDKRPAPPLTVLPTQLVERDTFRTN